MTTPDNDNNEIERASWLQNPLPGNLRSLCNWVSTRANLLYDGASLAFKDDPVPYAQIDHRAGMMDFKTSTPSKGKIAAVNFGASIVSKFLPVFIQGTSLAVQKGKGYDPLDYLEAAHDGLIQEVDFMQMLKYLGFDEEVKQLISHFGTFSEAMLQIAGKEYPLSTYRVTKEGEKSRLLLVDEKQNTGGRPPFFGGGGLFGSRKPVRGHI